MQQGGQVIQAATCEGTQLSKADQDQLSMNASFLASIVKPNNPDATRRQVHTSNCMYVRETKLNTPKSHVGNVGSNSSGSFKHSKPKDAIHMKSIKQGTSSQKANNTHAGRMQVQKANHTSSSHMWAQTTPSKARPMNSTDTCDANHAGKQRRPTALAGNRIQL